MPWLPSYNVASFISCRSAFQNRQHYNLTQFGDNPQKPDTDLLLWFVFCVIRITHCLPEKGAASWEIDRRLEKKLKITQKESRKSKSPPKVPIVIQDDSLPAGPPPQIRILKRPTTNGVLSNPNSASRPAFPVKSLAQREAEYAEARKRILGSASPEEEQEKPILDRPPRISQPEDTRQPNNVIRQPLGPDGSQGFKQRR
ncbi:SUZ RNA-binding domain-containing isoform 1-T1 [Morphnus guianensis]